MRKSILLGGAALALAAPSAASAAGTWYVRDGGNPAQPCGTSVAATCADVMDAVTQAGTDDTIDIGPGLFDEGVSTNKRLNFVGAGAATTLAGDPANSQPWGLRLINGGSVTSLRLKGRNESQVFSIGTGLELTCPPAPGINVAYTLTDVVAEAGTAYDESGAEALRLYADGSDCQMSMTVNGGSFDGSDNASAVYVDGVNADFTIQGAELEAFEQGSALAVSKAEGLVTDTHITAKYEGISLIEEQAQLTVARCTVRAGMYGLHLYRGAEMDLLDSLVVVDSSFANAAVDLESDNSADVTRFDATGSTIVVRATHEVAGLNAVEHSLSSSTVQASIRNTIIDASTTGTSSLATDVFLDHAGVAQFTASNSRYQTVHVEGNDSATPPGQGSNETDDPLFVDPASDFRLRTDSPLLDRGDPAAAGQLDLAGAARSQDGNGDGTAAPDLGAYEVPGMALPTPAPAEAAAGSTQATSDLLAPVFKGKLSFKRGRLTYKLSEPAKVTLKLERKLVRKAKSSARFRRVKTLTANGKAGANSVKLKKLKPGTYRIKLVATDAAGNSSKPTTTTFQVLRPKA